MTENTAEMTARNPLGQATVYPEQYSPDLLYAIPRTESRAPLGLEDELPFHGADLWNAWELTWLDANGLPQIATAEISVPAESANIIESKSLKLYLDSFAMSKFDSDADVAAAITKDLCRSRSCTGCRCPHPPSVFDRRRHSPPPCRSSS